MTFFKGLCIGGFYAFVPTCATAIIRHFAARKKLMSSVAASFGMAGAQLIWAFGAWIVYSLSLYLLQPKAPVVILFGSVMLFFLAAKTYHRQERLEIQHDFNPRFFPSLGVGFVFFFSLPLRFLGYFALFAILQIPSIPILSTTFSLLAGVFLGALLFWLGFTVCAHCKKDKLSPKAMHQLHKLAVVMLAIFTAFGIFKLYF